MESNYHVLVIGMGPVGLYLSYLLALKNVRIMVIDKPRLSRLESRAIGIHPPLVDQLEENFLLNKFLNSGVKIQESEVYSNNRLLLSLNFSNLATKNKYVLSIPQKNTEEILKNELYKFDNVRLVEGHLTDFQIYDDKVIACIENFGQVESKFLLGCDGKNSSVRRILNLTFKGACYRSRYCMADIEDVKISDFKARIFLGSSGLVESFPLPLKKRRWVVKIRTCDVNRHSDEIFREALTSRIAQDLRPSEIKNANVSAFTPEHYLSSKFYKGRVVLVGDAAHIISPIGGQGMNLGWLAASRLCSKIMVSLLNQANHLDLFESYEKQIKQITLKLKKRAEFNMFFGSSNYSTARSLLLKQLFNSPFKNRLLEQFTLGRL